MQQRKHIPIATIPLRFSRSKVCFMIFKYFLRLIYLKRWSRTASEMLPNTGKKQRDQIFKFLLWLHKNLEEVKGRVTSQIPLPSIREAFSVFRREESGKKVMMGHSNSAPNIKQLLKTRSTI